MSAQMILGSIVAIPAGLLLLHSRLFVKKHGLGWIIIRFAIGHHLDGKKRTNASFFRHGKRSADDHASDYAHMPHWYRMAIRWGAITFLLLTGYGMKQSRSITIDALVGLGALGLVFAVWKSSRKIKGRQHSRTMLNPMSEAMSGLLNVTPSVINDSLKVNTNYVNTKSGENVLTLVLPDSFRATPNEKAAVEDLINNRLGIELRYQWHTDKYPQLVTATRAPIPPSLVKFCDVVSIIRALPKGEILLGISGEGKHIKWDLNSEEPHMMVQATSRRGKTRLALLIICQLIFQGAEHVIIIDPKRVGFDTVLVNVPGVQVFNNGRKIEEMWAGIRSIREIMDERIDQLLVDRTIIFRQAVLVIDELSLFSMKTKNLWDQTRDPKNTKATPDIWQDVAAIAWEGAQVNVRCIVFGQRIEASTMASLVESFGTRLLAGYTKRGYDRLVGINPMPMPYKNRGRFLYFDGETLTWIQTVYEKDDQVLRDFAMERSARERDLSELLPKEENVDAA